MNTRVPKLLASIFAMSLVGIGQTGAQTATSSWSNTATRAYASEAAISTGAAADSEPISVVVSLQLRNRSQLETVAQSVSAGGAAPITHDEFMSTYAPTVTQAQAVASYLTAMGFSNVSVDDNRMLVSANGTVGTAAAAFNASFAHFTLNGKSGLANVTGAQVPSTLSDVILAVLGLQTVEEATTYAVPVGGPPPPSGLHGYDPTAFPLIYSANTLPTGSGANVGIFSEGKLTQVLSDLELFESQNSLPILSPSIVYVGSPSGDTSNTGEWDLDSQSIQAMAGGTLGSLTFYVAPSLQNSDMAATFSKIVSVDTAKIINVSVGECEATAYNSGFLATADQTFLSAVAQGQTFSVATGDNGSRTCGANGNFTYGTSISVSYPASSPYVVAVGGTTLQTNTDGTWLTETAWSYSGGGISAYEQPTQWTQGVTSAPSAVRAIPDVAMDADPNTGALIAVNGVYPTQWGGTSLASPLFVGAWARIETAQGNRFGYPNPLIYSQAVPIAAFHDITVGNNDDYSAAPNWDYTTGWGSVIAATLSTNLAALPIAPTNVSDSNAGYACPSDFIQWPSVSGASSYELYEKQDLPSNDRLFILDWSGTDTSVEITLGRGQEFTYAVKACTSDGCSQVSTRGVIVKYGTCP